ncbi:MAG TPA: MraY family glycosyltransferase [Pyrinomonadaceae bacterium]
MNTYLLLFLISAGGSLLLTPIVRRICERFQWLDVPLDERRVHHRPVPHLGGVAIFASALLALATLPFIHNLLTEALSAKRQQIVALFAPAVLIFLFGVYDDFRGSNARLKFLAQGLAGLLFCLLGGRIEALSLPLVGSVALPPILGYALTLVWTVGICNAFNLIDGLDGLAVGASLFAALVLLVVSLVTGQVLLTVVAVVLCGSLIGFLRYNFNPASIFMGDSGALFIGFTLAALSVQGTQKASTAVAVAIPLLAFGLPVVDTGFSMVRRFMSGHAIFEGDREHIHHMLLARGWSQRRIALVLYAACAAFGLLALLLVSDFGRRTTGLVLLVVAAAVLFSVWHLGYHEVDEVKAGMRRNLMERRLRIANNIHVRRASHEMSKATTLNEIFHAMQILLEVGEFACATVQLGRGGDDAHTAQALMRERRAVAVFGVELRGGLINWTWKRGHREAEEVVRSGRFWTMRLPLSTENAGWGYISLYREIGSDALLLDINYLCDLFQREMAQAVERVLGVGEHKANVLPLVASAAAGG